ncbi:DEIH-box ATPase [Serendipita sp. 411]|nr:DEIH-box ATPase [Serendipita sp. 397]KAG8845949.1 DEIH-box ATPase [Serendipita sp. 411]
MEMEDDDRAALLNMTPGQLRDVAAFVNAYPSLEVAHEFEEGDYTSTEPVSLKVTLSGGEEEDEEEDEDQSEPVVIAPFYPIKKIPNWWLVVGDPQSRQLIGIRRVTVPKKSLTVDLKLTLGAGSHKLHLYVICDSFMGCDHDVALEPIQVAQGDSDDSDEDDDEDEEMEDA